MKKNLKMGFKNIISAEVVLLYLPQDNPFKK